MVDLLGATKFFILFPKTNQYIEANLNFNTALEDLKLEATRRFNEISKNEKILKCRLFNSQHVELQGTTLQECCIRNDNVIFIATDLTETKDYGRGGVEIITPSATTNSPRDDSLLPSHHKNESNAHDSRDNIHNELDEFKELVQDRIMKMQNEQNSKYSQLEGQVQKILEVLMTKSTISNQIKDTVSTSNVSCSHHSKNHADKNSFIAHNKNISSQFEHGLNPLGTFILNPNDEEDVHSEGGETNDCNTTIDSRSNSSKSLTTVLKKEFSLDAGSFPTTSVQNPFSNELVLDPAKQPQNNSTSEYSSIFSDKENDSMDFNELFGIVPGGSPPLPMRQQQQEEEESSDAVGDILGLQTNEYSTSFPPSSAKQKSGRNKHKGIKKRFSFLLKPKKRIKKSIKRKGGRLLQVLKKKPWN